MSSMGEYQFQKIKNSDAFASLQRDIIIPKNSEIAYNAIFQHTKLELEQTEKAIAQIFTTISNDVDTEIKQGELLDSKLKSTFKRLKYTYRRVLSQRAKHAKYQLSTQNPVASKHLNHLEKTIGKCDHELKDIELMSNNIIENLVAINNNFGEDNNVPILSLDNLSGQQYPTLFKILKQRHPEVMTQRINKIPKKTLNQDAESVDLHAACSVTNSFSNSTHSTSESAQMSITSNVDREIIINSTHTDARNGDGNNADSSVTSSNLMLPLLIPLFLRKKAMSSTATTLQNISGEKVTATHTTKK